MLLTKTTGTAQLAEAAVVLVPEKAQQTSAWAHFLNGPRLPRLVSAVILVGMSILAWDIIFRLLRLLIY